MSLSKSWSDFGLSGPKNLNLDEILKIESILNIEFPFLYKSLVEYANPAYIEVGSFYYGDDETCISDFFPLTQSHEYGSFLWYAIDNSIIPKDVLPFARDAGDFLICFDYRETKTSPKIILLDSFLSEIYPISNNFKDFLELLHE
ncbi:MAG: SMI1/KNR4 family protein [Acinetobacter calcoaceticus]